MSPVGRRVLAGAVLAAGVAAYAPLVPLMPSNRIDPSWMLALNQAQSQGLVFGRDIVFTLGPYSTLFSQAYHPATYPLALALGVLLGLCHGALLLTAAAPQRRAWLAACAGFLLLIDSRDALFFFYPLLVLWLAGLASLPAGDPRHLTLPPASRLVYAVAVALLGVLPLIKVSFLPLALVAALGGCVLFCLQRAWGFAALFLLLPALTMLLAWPLAGQPLGALPDYFSSVAPLVAGYGEAMSLYPGSRWWVLQVGPPAIAIALVAMALALLHQLWRNRPVGGVRTWALPLGASLYVYVSLKAALVRQDGAHVVAASCALVLALLALKAWDASPVPNRLVLLALALWLGTHGLYLRLSLADAPLARLASLVSHDRTGPPWHRAFNEALAAIRVHDPVLRLQGSTDIYPTDQAALIASGNRYAPRPVPQSYAVYTPELAQRNQAWLAGPQAPDNVVLAVDPIDRHLPALEDGFSWPTLLTHYALTQQDAHYLYFKRRPAPLPQSRQVVLQADPAMGEMVGLPPGPAVLFAQIEVQPSLLGRLANGLFKTSPLYITITTADGQSQTFRFIAGMARAGFILSPLVLRNADLLQLASAPVAAAQPHAVQGFRMATSAGCALLWQAHYRVTLLALQTGTTPAVPTP